MSRTKFLLRTSAIYALIGTFMGSHMAGAGSMLLRAIHAHILVVGWLSLFAFAIFYRVYPIPKNSKLATIQVWTAFIGAFGLTSGMYIYYIKPDFIPEIVQLLFYIIGGTVLVVSFILFTVMTFVHSKGMTDKE
ncbi:hypothetical protein RYX56_06910 [Alkalihalophilus lindianensis]|uniref:Cbb3-type cytochrome c oxidase subunit I n=1 Tax=Alkalihalophilus lindianensis TaxID=1630542 RepID=A0ABU3X887_9BACI|nr:hypothetical protein [Alkalihalophilus lindianensis]MDV2684095.1 hypothetical protein [Alkalihalophilus lindianensis]